METNLLETLKMLIPRINGTWFLMDGSLLGLVREGKLIDYDNDIDLYVLEDTTFDLEGSDLEKEKYYICDKIYNKHNKKIKVNPWLEYMSIIKLNNQHLNRSEIMVKAKETYKENKIIPSHTENHIDIFYIKKIGNKYYLNDKAKFGLLYLTEEEFVIKKNYDLGFEVNIPSNAEDILKRQYGSDWMIPNKDFKYY